MSGEVYPSVRQSSGALRALLAVGSVLAFIAWVQLFVFSEQTAQYFAWAINPPLTAAFLGAGYGAGVVLALLSARERVWAHARASAVGVEVFSTLALITTLLHLDRFRLDTVFGWAWLVVYVAIPPLLGLLIAWQARVPGADPPRRAALSPALRAVLGVQGVIMLVASAALFLAPSAAAPLWPWPLTPLTARAVAFWLAGLGTVAVLVVWENDRARTRIPALSLLLFGVLQVLALARYPGVPNWGGASAWVYAAFLLSLLAVSLWFAPWRRYLAPGAGGQTAAAPAATPGAP